MLYANNEFGERVEASPKAEAVCPTCGAEMVPKCGSTIVWHWAHRSIKDCDTWSEGETVWHAAWKSRFANNEVTITGDAGFGRQSHRADAVNENGVVLEFQHSGISADEIRDRERFYGRMVWVLDAIPAFRGSRIWISIESPESGKPYCRFKWKHRKSSFDAATAPLFLDIGLSVNDTGQPFMRESSWWDDSIGGLRDGIRRGPGVWQRVVTTTHLIEVKKFSDGSGWGRLVTHGDFCRRFGASVIPNHAAMPGVRRLPSAYSAMGSYIAMGLSYPEIPREVCESNPYGWCEREARRSMKA